MLYSDGLYWTVAEYVEQLLCMFYNVAHMKKHFCESWDHSTMVPQVTNGFRLITLRPEDATLNTKLIAVGVPGRNEWLI